MEKEFVTYEQALVLKELGFSAEPIGGTHENSIFYYEKGKLYYDHRPMYSSDAYEGQILAPLYQQAFRWFRDKHMLKGEVSHADSNGSNKFTLWKWNHDNNIGKWERIGHIGTYNSWEEAESACLDKLIEIIKNECNK